MVIEGGRVFPFFSSVVYGRIYWCIHHIRLASWEKYGFWMCVGFLHNLIINSKNEHVGLNLIVDPYLPERWVRTFVVLFVFSSVYMVGFTVYIELDWPLGEKYGFWMNGSVGFFHN